MGPARSINLAWSRISEKLTGHGVESDHGGSDVSGRGGCLLDSNRTLGVMRPVSCAARPVTLVRERVLLNDSYDRMNKSQSETRGVHRGGHSGVTGRCARLVRPDQHVRSPRVWLFHEPTTLFLQGLLYILVGQLFGATLGHFDSLTFF
jgi:hypothetical protein